LILNLPEVEPDPLLLDMAARSRLEAHESRGAEVLRRHKARELEVNVNVL